MQLVFAKTIHTLASGTGDALALEGERVVAVGGREELAARFPEATPIDLGARTVVPGFVDAHHHLSMGNPRG